MNEVDWNKLGQKVVDLYGTALLGAELNSETLNKLAEANRIVLEEFSTIEDLPVQEKML